MVKRVVSNIHRPRIVLSALFLLLLTPYSLGESAFGQTDVKQMVSNIHWLGHDSFRLPVSGTYVMTADEAAEAVAIIKPRVAIPMHIGRGIGSGADAERFKEKASVPVVILPMEK